MFQKNEHPSDEKIMEFLSASQEEIFDNANEYMSLIVHFAQCEKCRNTKDEMMDFNEETKQSFRRSSNNYEQFITKVQKALIYLENINKSDELNAGNFLVGVKGYVADKANVSKIYADKYKTAISNDNDMRFVYAKKNNNKIEEPILNKLIDSKNDSNKIAIGGNKISVSIDANSKSLHKILIIPENDAESPIINEMKKHGKEWTVSCKCSSGKYDIVLF